MAASLLPVSEVAEALGLSPRRVRALIEAGQLPAQRSGRSWFVSAGAVERFRVRARGHGRPLSPSNAWALLALLDGDNPDWVRPDVRSRLRRYARDPDWLVSAIAQSKPRADVHALWLAADDLPKLNEYPLLRSGLSAREALAKLDVIPHREEPLDAYASPEVARELMRRFIPEEGVDDPNLILRIADVPSKVSEGEEAPLAIAAADLLAHDDPRVRRAGQDALRELALAG